MSSMIGMADRDVMHTTGATKRLVVGSKSDILGRQTGSQDDLVRVLLHGWHLLTEEQRRVARARAFGLSLPEDGGLGDG